MNFRSTRNRLRNVPTVWHVCPNAKSFPPETNPQFMGIYWGSASSPGCRKVVESSDAYLFTGPIFSDYTTVGFSALGGVSMIGGNNESA